MTQQEIQDSINAEYAAFLARPYEPILPSWFLERFEEALMEVPQATVPYRGELIQAIINKTLTELSVFEVGFITEIYLVVAPKFVDKTLRGFVLKKVQLENIRLQYNEMQDREKKRMQNKARTLNTLTNPNRLAKA